MPSRKLPLDNSPEAREIKKEYEFAPRSKLEEWTEKYRFADVSSFVSQVNKKWNLRRKWIPDSGFRAPDKPDPILKLLSVKIKPYAPIKLKGKGDPETQVLLFNDHHAGEITSSYNPKVYHQRMDNLYKGMLGITYLHRNMYPVNDLAIILLGDMVHGENPKQGAKIGTVSCGAQEQVYDIALPELTNFVISLKEHFKSIKLYAVRGNHGRYSRYAPPTSNWDIMLYKALKNVVKTHGMEMSISDDFNLIATIQGFRFFCFHGDQIRSVQGIPYFALIRKVMSWNTTFQGFPYALCGHWHKDDFLRISSETKLIINSSLVSDDPYALEVIGTSSIPAQAIFGVHNRVGLTWYYSLVADSAFYPKKE